MNRSPSAKYILVVEDSSSDAALIRESLKEHRITLDVVLLTDGERAIRFMDEVDRGTRPCPALVVLDLNLPKKNGREVLRRIRQIGCCRTAPIAIFSSSDAASDKQDAAQLGANRYIRKPSNIDEFLRVGAVLKLLIESD